MNISETFSTNKHSLPIQKSFCDIYFYFFATYFYCHESQTDPAPCNSYGKTFGIDKADIIDQHLFLNEFWQVKCFNIKQFHLMRVKGQDLFWISEGRDGWIFKISLAWKFGAGLCASEYMTYVLEGSEGRK